MGAWSLRFVYGGDRGSGSESGAGKAIGRRRFDRRSELVDETRRGGEWSTGSRHRRTVPGRGDLEDLLIGPLLLRLGLDVQEEVAARGGHVVRICWVAMGELLSRSLARGRRRRDGRATSWVIDGASELRRVRDEPLARGPESRAAGCAARAREDPRDQLGAAAGIGLRLRVQGKSRAAAAVERRGQNSKVPSSIGGAPGH